MSVQDSSPQYSYLQPIWHKIRIAARGQEAVKSEVNQTTYLPCPAGYDPSWYNGALQRAYWLDATGCAERLSQGSIFRKSPTITPDPTEQQKEFLDSVDKNGNDLNTFATNVVNDVTKTSYGGILIDYDDTHGQILTQEQAEELGIKARLIFYPAESIFNPEKNSIRLWEVYHEQIDEFTAEAKKQIKVLDFVFDTDSNKKVYRQRIFREIESDKKKKEWLQFGADIFPAWPGGEKLDFIPFQFIGAKNNDSDPDTPILEGLVNANFQHYGLYSDFREALHWIRPITYRTGEVDDAKAPQTLNSNVMLTSRSPETKFGILEFRGSGLEWDVKALEILEAQMAAMGAEMLKSKKKASESADKARIDKSGEASILATMANNISSAITISINIMLKWNGEEGEELTYQLNTDYDATLFDAQLMTSINKSVESGTMSQRSAIHNYKKGELLPDGISVEDETLQIEAEASGLGGTEELHETIRNIVGSMSEET